MEEGSHSETHHRQRQGGERGQSTTQGPIRRQTTVTCVFAGDQGTCSC